MNFGCPTVGSNPTSWECCLLAGKARPIQESFKCQGCVCQRVHTTNGTFGVTVLGVGWHQDIYTILKYDRYVNGTRIYNTQI